MDKAWHLIHFLLTGKAEGGEWPFCFILEGGNRSGPDEADGDEDEWADEDGTSQSFTASQVREIAAALTPLTPDVLAARWDPTNPEARRPV